MTCGPMGPRGVANPWGGGGQTPTGQGCQAKNMACHIFPTPCFVTPSASIFTDIYIYIHIHDPYICIYVYDIFPDKVMRIYICIYIYIYIYI